MGTGALLIAQQYKERHARRESGLSVTEGAQEYVDLGTQNIGLISGLARACEMKQQELSAMANLAGLRTLFRGCLSRMSDVEIAGWDGPHAPCLANVKKCPLVRFIQKGRKSFLQPAQCGAE